MSFKEDDGASMSEMSHVTGALPVLESDELEEKDSEVMASRRIRKMTGESVDTWTFDDVTLSQSSSKLAPEMDGVDSSSHWSVCENIR